MDFLLEIVFGVFQFIVGLTRGLNFIEAVAEKTDDKDSENKEATVPREANERNAPEHSTEATLTKGIGTYLALSNFFQCHFLCQLKTRMSIISCSSRDGSL